jgi:hypothetical protein
MAWGGMRRKMVTLCAVKRRLSSAGAIPAREKRKERNMEGKNQNGRFSRFSFDFSTVFPVPVCPPV